MLETMGDSNILQDVGCSGAGNSNFGGWVGGFYLFNFRGFCEIAFHTKQTDILWLPKTFFTNQGVI